jgi:hypothetical protein
MLATMFAGRLGVNVVNTSLSASTRSTEKVSTEVGGVVQVAGAGVGVWPCAHANANRPKQKTPISLRRNLVISDLRFKWTRDIAGMLVVPNAVG